MIFIRMARFFPALKIRLKQAGMQDKPEDFIKKTFISSLYMSAGLILFMFLLLSKFSNIGFMFFLGVPIIFAGMFFYMMKLPDLKVAREEKEVAKEIVFAGRFIIIELESGVPLYNAMINISKSYPIVGKYFREITNKIDLGTSMEEALNEATDLVPSNDLRRILWQIINSIRTGTDVGKSLYSVMDQVTKDQLTEVNKYGKKLNPLAMFYMIMAVIMPSLGVTMLIILSSFIKFELNLTILMVISLFLAFIQFMFISIVKLSRPPIEF